MPVDLPQLLVVLSHELRSPVGVLHGYLRLLERTAAGAPPDRTMIEGMRAAATTIGQIGQDASALARFLQGADPPAPRAVADLATALGEGLPPSIRLDQLPPRTAPLQVLTSDVGELSLALIAVAVGAARDWEPSGTVVSIDAGPPPDIHVVLVPAPDGGRPGTLRFAFSNGGHGLSLVRAAVVLERHGATIDAEDARLVVRLPGAPEPA